MFAVLFEVQPHAAQMQQYLHFGKLLRPELEQIDGFIDNERFTSASDSARILSLSTWRDEKALISLAHACAAPPGAGARARAGVRRLRAARRRGCRRHGAASRGIASFRQRFDATEASIAKIVTLVEIAPGRRRFSRCRLHAATIDPAHAPAGWVASEQFASIYHPGKLAILSGWRDAESARAWQTAAIAPSASPALRYRVVRVIRAYGMADRAEAPQYYPPCQRSFSRRPTTDDRRLTTDAPTTTTDGCATDD